MQPEGAVVVFDGVCVLCSRWVGFISARDRYRWFGRRETCLVPTPGLRARFIE